jgi:hypothetical protein
MLEHNRQKTAAEADDLVRIQQAHQDKLLAELRSNPRCTILELSFPELIANPESAVESLVAFLGVERLPERGRMAVAVRPDLFRNRG